MTAGSAAYGRPSSCRPAGRRRAGISSAPTRREEAVDEHALESSRAARRRARRRSSRVPWPSTATGCSSPVGSREQRLLRDAALVPQRPQLPGVERWPSCSSRCCTSAGERQVHVVAAEQDVVADRDALERRGRRRRSPTAIRLKSVVPPPTSHTSTTSPTRKRLRQRVARAVEPGVEGGLRLLEQRDVREPGLAPPRAP